jgi:hypothetical protein
MVACAILPATCCPQHAELSRPAPSSRTWHPHPDQGGCTTDNLTMTTHNPTTCTTAQHDTQLAMYALPHLSISDGDHVGSNVSRHVTSLCLNHGEGSEAAPTHVVGHLGGTLQQAGVQVEHVTRESLTAGRAAQQQGHLTVRHRLRADRQACRQGVGSLVIGCLVLSSATWAANMHVVFPYSSDGK